MRKELEQSTKLLCSLREYVTHIRRQVLNDIDLAKKGNFTYIGLDELDDILIQIMRNEDALKKGTKDGSVKSTARRSSATSSKRASRSWPC